MNQYNLVTLKIFPIDKSSGNFVNCNQNFTLDSLSQMSQSTTIWCTSSQIISSTFLRTTHVSAITVPKETEHKKIYVEFWKKTSNFRHKSPEETPCTSLISDAILQNQKGKLSQSNLYASTVKTYSNQDTQQTLTQNGINFSCLLQLVHIKIFWQLLQIQLNLWFNKNHKVSQVLPHLSNPSSALSTIKTTDSNQFFLHN